MKVRCPSCKSEITLNADATDVEAWLKRAVPETFTIEIQVAITAACWVCGKEIATSNQHMHIALDPILELTDSFARVQETLEAACKDVYESQGLLAAVKYVRETLRCGLLEARNYVYERRRDGWKLPNR